MRRSLAPLLALLLLAACASSDGASVPRQESGPPIGVTFRQINGSRQMFRNRGQVSLQYIVTITNPTDEPYEIDRVEVISTVPGAYSIRADSPTRVGRTIPPKMGLNIPINTWGYAAGGRLQMEEPVTVAVMVYATGWDKKAVVKRVQRTVTNFNERDGD